MALDVNRLKGKIKAALQSEQNEEEDYNASLDRISDKLAQAFVDEIKELQINYVSGLVAPNGPVTGDLSSVTIS